MTKFFDRYYALILALAVPAPLWLGGLFSGQPIGMATLRDGLVWSAVFVGGWLLVRICPRYQIRGAWNAPKQQESRLYLRILLAVLIIDFGSKALFFRWDRPQQVEIMKNFGLHSVFHPTPYESFHIILMLYFFYLFVLAPLYFRFSNRALDRIWIVSCATALGGTIALVLERLLFAGVHNSFYFAGGMMWLCPPCVSPIAISYAWTPTDFFWHMAVAPIFLLLASYFVPGTKPDNGQLPAHAARVTLLQDGAP